MICRTSQCNSNRFKLSYAYLRATGWQMKNMGLGPSCSGVDTDKSTESYAPNLKKNMSWNHRQKNTLRCSIFAAQEKSPLHSLSGTVISNSLSFMHWAASWLLAVFTEWSVCAPRPSPPTFLPHQKDRGSWTRHGETLKRLNGSKQFMQTHNASAAIKWVMLTNCEMKLRVFPISECTGWFVFLWQYKRFSAWGSKRKGSALTHRSPASMRSDDVTALKEPGIRSPESQRDRHNSAASRSQRTHPAAPTKVPYRKLFFPFKKNF